MSFNTAHRPRKFKGSPPLTAAQYEVRVLSERLRDLALDNVGKKADLLRDAADRLEELAGLK